MKLKTKTIRVPETLHGSVKKYIQPFGYKLEGWIARALVFAMQKKFK